MSDRVTEGSDDVVAAIAARPRPAVLGGGGAVGRHVGSPEICDFLQRQQILKEWKMGLCHGAVSSMIDCYDVQ